MLYYTRNSDLSYYEQDDNDANCGSYALRLNEWYDPTWFFEKTMNQTIEDWIISEGENYTDKEMSDILTEILLSGILEEFEGELEVCDGKLPTTKNIELIAFNTFCHYDEDDDFSFSDWDFHFKVYRDGGWKEKCGWLEVTKCTEEWGKYIGEPVYLYHKIVA